MTTAAIPLSRPSLGDEEAEAAARVVRSGWLAQGPEVAALEREFGLYLDPVDPPYVVATSSCTTALHLSLLALGVGPRSVAVCPSLTFIATANAIRYCGAAPTLGDVDPATMNLDVGRPPLDRAAPPDVVVPVHQVGLPCPIRPIRDRWPGALIVEDAACAIGARNADGTQAGSIRGTAAACFSLHGSKSVVAGEGGLVATRDALLALRVRSLRDHGVDVPAADRPAGHEEQYTVLGHNHRMTDLQAAVARVQIRKADGIVAARRLLARRYDAELRGLVDVPPDPTGGHAYQRYAIRLRDRAERERVVAHLLSRGISCRRGIQVVHRQPAWRADFAVPALPATEAVADTTAQIPLWAGMSDSEQAEVVDGVRNGLG